MQSSMRRFVVPALGFSLAPIAVLCLAFTSLSTPEQAASPVTKLHPGLEHLATRAYSPPIMDPVVFANLWRSWDPASRDLGRKGIGKDQKGDDAETVRPAGSAV